MAVILYLVQLHRSVVVAVVRAVRLIAVALVEAVLTDSALVRLALEGKVTMAVMVAKTPVPVAAERAVLVEMPLAIM
jgi:hypothetical protein